MAVTRRDPQAQVRLFGSRADDSKAGGDIDLIVVSELLNFSDKLQILAEIKGSIGDQKIDMILATMDMIARDAFLKKAYKEGVLL